jgi:hypothetical protein
VNHECRISLKSVTPLIEGLKDYTVIGAKTACLGDDTRLGGLCAADRLHGLAHDGGLVRTQDALQGMTDHRFGGRFPP